MTIYNLLEFLLFSLAKPNSFVVDTEKEFSETKYRMISAYAIKV